MTWIKSMNAQQKALRKLGFQQWPISFGVSNQL